MNSAIISLIGRPNVGKSTLFNRLSKSRTALVSDFEGLTRDRQYAKIKIQDNECNIIDTGGVTNNENLINSEINTQIEQALKDSDIVYFMVSKKDGINALDMEIAKKLRKIDIEIILICNKSEGSNKQDLVEFYELGLGEAIAISAEHGKGIDKLIDKTATLLDKHKYQKDTKDVALNGIIVAMFGRPNVGKSTLINKILGQNRVLATDVAGTTRDSIFIPFTKNKQIYTLIDTAGIRRKSNVNNKIEKFSIVKTIDALSKCHVAILLLDSSEGITEQDASILGMIDDKGKALLIVNNKWDGLDDYQKQEVKRKLDIKMSFINYASVHYISALNGFGVNKIFTTINKAYKNAGAKFNTSILNNVLIKANATHNAPMSSGRRIKLKYIHQSGVFPPTFTIHGNNLLKIPNSYINYLKNFFIRELGISNTPIKFYFKTSDNPFKDKKNKLTNRQIKSRKRLIKFVKNKK